jgi:tRNA-2-methylthio-N6-dimethylallyladenosine synthase
MQNRLSLESNQRDLGKIFRVLIEGDSKKSSAHWMGRTSENKVMIFPKTFENLAPGQYVDVRAMSCTQGTLIGEIAAMH